VQQQTGSRPGIASVCTARAAVALVAVCTLALTVVPTVHAEFGIASFDGTVSNADGSVATQAGSHPYSASTTIQFNTFTEPNGVVMPDESVKDIHVDLPPGFVGNPTVVLQCSEGQLVGDGDSPTCPDGSQVGITVVRVPFRFPETFTEPVYNMVPPPDSPAEFGFNAFSVLVHLTAHVRSDGNYGLTVNVPNINQTLPVLGTTLTFWGVPAESAHDIQRCQELDLFATPPTCDGFTGGPRSQPHSAGIPLRPFLTNPTDCPAGPLTTTLRVDSWAHPGIEKTASFVSHDNATPPNPVGVTGCDIVPFGATLQAQPDTLLASAPTGFAFDLQVPQDENPTGIAPSTLRRAVVTLPEGVAISPSAAYGLQGCSDAQIGLKSTAQDACPPASKMGTVSVVTPLLEAPLEGSVYLGTPDSSDPASGQMYRLFIVAEDPARGVRIKLAGSVVPDPVSGRLTATFDNNPQLPFSDLKLSFKGGPRAPLSNPRSCGTFTTTSDLTPWSAPFTPDATPSSSFQITSCPGPQFNPSLSAGTVNPQAGGFSPFALTFSRGDADQMLAGVTVQTPPGLLAVLKSVPQCPEPQASQGACGSESLIGHTTVGAGPGSNPFYVGGNVFLTGPYKGAPFGLSIVVHALAGPFDLGNVIVRAAVNIDPHTAQVTVTSDPLPQILKGVPLQIRTVNVTIDRSGFMFNPTNCSPLSVGGMITSTQGAAAAVANRFEAVNCATLPFKPKFTVLTHAATSKANGAYLHVKVASGSGQANIAKVKVALPRALPSRLTTLQKACLAATFEANPASCPEGSLVGEGTAVTPLLAHPLAGPAYLVSHGGAAFPDLEIVLQGEGITLVLDGHTNIKKGITTSMFNTVPDAPISTFDLVLPQGPHSALTGYGSPCKGSLKMPTTITGQNGAQVEQTTRIAVTGCPRHRAKKTAKRKRKGTTGR
jgi:hypothetical protein